MISIFLRIQVDDVLEKRGPFREGHLGTAAKFKKSGDLVMGGAYADPVDGALVVFNSKEAAENFVKEDPYVQNGIVTNYTVREWTTVKV